MKKVLMILFYFSPFLWSALFVMLSAGEAPAQKIQLDSLKKLLIENNNGDEKQLQLLNAIASVQVNIYPNDALINADKAIVLAQKLNNQKQLSIAYNNKGFILLRKSEYEDANSFLKKSMRINTALKNQIGIANNQTNLAEILRRQGNVDSAKTILEKTMQLYQQQKDINGIADSYYYLSLVYRDLSDNQNMLLFNGMAMELYRQTGNECGRALAINAKAGFYYRIGDYKKAIEIGRQALLVNQSIGNLYGLSLDYGNISISYSEMADYPKSIELLLKSFRIDEQMGNNHLLANDYILAGTSYFELGQFQTALYYLKKGTELFDQLKINNGQYRMGYNYLGITYLYLNDTSQSFKSLYKALAVNLASKDDWALSDCYNHLGEAYLYTKNYDSSLFYFKAGLVIDKNIDNPLGISLEYLGIGKSISKANDQTIANAGLIAANRNKLIVDYYQKAGLLGEKTGNKKVIRDVYKELSNYFETQKQEKISFDFYKKYITYKDSIANTDNANAIALLQLQYDTEKKEKQIALLTKESQLQQINLQKQSSTRNVFIIAFALIALLAGIIYNRYRVKQNANAEIEKTLHHLKTTQVQLVEHEKLATLGKFTAEVAREMEVPVKQINQLAKLNRMLIFKIKNNYSIVDIETLNKNLYNIFNYGKKADKVVKKVLFETRKVQE